VTLFLPRGIIGTFNHWRRERRARDSIMTGEAAARPAE
jgi:hypothetical protein